MPPRKKAKLSSRAASSPSVDTPKETSPAAATKNSPEEKGTKQPVLDPDPWSDEQEAALFKAIVRYKPVGECDDNLYLCRAQPNVVNGFNRATQAYAYVLHNVKSTTLWLDRRAHVPGRRLVEAGHAL